MEIKTIDINAKEWRDKINGNSYFSARVIINYKLKDEISFILPFQYGYDNHYIDMGKEQIEKQLNLKKGLLSRDYLEDNKIILRANKQINCLKRELNEFVGGVWI